MSSSLRRGALAAAAIAFSIASLAACAAGNDAQTLEVKPDNAAVTVGAIKLQNVSVITQPDLESTGPAVITATVFNNGTTAQTLDAITIAGTGKTAEIHPAKGKGKLVVPAGGSLVIGGKDNASAVLPSSREAVKDGNAQKVTFSFSKAGDVSLRAYVVPADRYFKTWGPTGQPTPPSPSASPKPSGSPSGKPTDAASSSATATATATASATATESAAQ